MSKSFQHFHYVYLARYGIEFHVFFVLLQIVLSLFSPLILVLFLSILQILVSLYNQGQLFLGYDLLHEYKNQDQPLEESRLVDEICLHPLMNKPLFKVTKEISLLVSRFITCCSVACSQPVARYVENGVLNENGSSESNASVYKFQCLLLSLRILRASMRMVCGSLSEDLTEKYVVVLNIIEYYIHFAFAWFRRNCRGLFLLMKPLLITQTDGHTIYDADLATIKLLLPEVAGLVCQSIVHDDVGEIQISKHLPENQDPDTNYLISEDEQWKIIGACLWQHMLKFLKHKLNAMSFELEGGCVSGLSHGTLSSGSSSTNLEFDENNSKEKVELATLTLVKVMKTTAEQASSYHVKQLGSYLEKKLADGCQSKAYAWLEESNQSQRVTDQIVVKDSANFVTVNGKDGFNSLWEFCTDSRMISESLATEKMISLHDAHKPSKSWSEMYTSVGEPGEAEDIHSREGTPSSSSSPTVSVRPTGHQSQSNHSPSPRQKDIAMVNEIVSFLSPKEVLKRNGELLEVNSILELFCILHL